MPKLILHIEDGLEVGEALDLVSDYLDRDLDHAVRYPSGMYVALWTENKKTGCKTIAVQK